MNFKAGYYVDTYYLCTLLFAWSFSIIIAVVELEIAASTDCRFLEKKIKPTAILIRLKWRELTKLRHMFRKQKW
jgi:hypothetical protein